MNSFFEKLNSQDISFFVIISLVAFFFLIGNIIITEDGVWYLTTASSILHGKEYVNTDGSNVILRPPLFQLTLIPFFKLFGETLFSATLVLRIFWGIIGLLFFFLIKKLFNWQIALASFFLVLSTPQLAILSFYFLLDYPLAFFIILILIIGLYTLKEENRRKEYFFYGLMGTVMGLGILFKEVMLIFSPFPFFLLFLKEEKILNRVKKFFVYLIVLSATISPWIVYATIQNGDISSSFYFILGHFSSVKQETPSSPLHTPSLNFSNILSTIILAINSFFIFGPFGFLAWVYFFYKTFRKKEKKWLLLVILFFLYLPLMVYLALKKDEGIYMLNFGSLNRQFIGLSLSTIVIFTVTIYDTLKYLLKKAVQGPVKILSPGKENLVFNALFFGAIFSFSILLISIIPFNSKFNLITNTIQGLKSKGVIQASGFLNKADRKLAEEISNVIPKNSNVMTWRTSGDIFNFLLPGRYSFSFFPAYYLINNLPAARVDLLGFKEAKKLTPQKGDKVISLWTDFPKRHRIQYLTERQLLSSLKENSVQYIITSHTLNFFSLYFEKNPGFQEIFSTKDGFAKVFKVKELKPVKDFTPLLEETVRQFILNPPEKKEAELLFSDFQRNFGWSRKEVKNLAKEQKTKLYFRPSRKEE